VAAGAYLLLSLVITFPLVARLTTGVPHDLGDPLLSTAVLWWNAAVPPLTAEWWNGPWFHPEPGTLAFSDHRLGGSLLASPLQWAGLGPVAAYNLTLLLSFVLSATAAFALVLAVSGRRDAAALAGLAYGFNPYRLAHIEHLELLMAFGMPLALLALHRFHATGRRRWLGLLGAALFLQGLSSSYYLLFFSVFMAGWLAWFMRPREWRALLVVSAVSLLPAALLAPVYLRFAEIHRAYNFKRAGYEIVFQSADVTSVLTASPLLALWGWTSGLNGPEKQTFPGAAIVVLAVAGAAAAIRSRRVPGAPSSLARRLGALAVAVLAVALAAQVWGPFRWSLGPVRLSIDALHKPLSIALVFALAALACSRRFRDAYARQSLLAFYGLMAGLMYLLSLGPQPKLLGADILYRPPYAWLMALPGFDGSIRVPARFAMPAALALAVAGALGFARLVRSGRAAGWASALCVLAILADTWPRSFPVPEAPEPWPTDARRLAEGMTGVMELPLGGAEYDAAAMYRVAFHGLPTVNGMSGYLTPRYRALARAIAGHEPEALQHLAATGPLLIAADKRDEPYQHWAEYVAAAPGVSPIGEDDRWRYFRLERRTFERRVCGERTVHPVGAVDGAGPIDLAPLNDEQPGTLRSTLTEQALNDEIVVDFGEERSLCGVGFSLGSQAEDYPRHLQVEVSRDGRDWAGTFDGSTSGQALDAALAHPLDARIELPLPGGPVRFVRLRLVRTRPEERWVLAELYGRLDPR